MKAKLTSRKFWVAISQIVAGLTIVFGLSDSTSAVITGAIVSVSSAIIYMVTEGKIDAAKAAQVITDVQTVVETLENDEAIKDRLAKL